MPKKGSISVDKLSEATFVLLEEIRKLRTMVRTLRELILKRHVMEPHHSHEDHECAECEALTDTGDEVWTEEELKKLHIDAVQLAKELNLPMPSERQYCDDCGEVLEGEKFVPFSELPFNVASANEGECAILCLECLDKHGWGLCYVCKNPLDLGGGDEVGSCDKCKKAFHTACDQGWHKEGHSHYCSACLP